MASGTSRRQPALIASHACLLLFIIFASSAAFSPPPSPAHASVGQRDQKLIPPPSSVGATASVAAEEKRDEVLTCRIVGLYPFLGGPPRGLAGWLFRDTHQAILVRSSSRHHRCRSVSIDFMTEGGQSHPVWWNDGARWAILLGGSIRGEIRVRGLPSDDVDTDASVSPKMKRIVQAARAYDREMNLYRNNCRIFCARMEREVELVNREGRVEVGVGDEDRGGTTTDNRLSSLLADGRCAVRILGASLLPALYPLTSLWLCWEGLRGL